MPCAFGLGLLAQPVTALLGGYEGEKLVLATQLMTGLGFTIIFNAIVLRTTALMQAHGHVNRPVVNMFIGGILKLVAVYILTGNRSFGILGTPIGTLLCYIVICSLNIFSISTLIENPPAIVRNLVRPFLAAAVMGVFAWGSWKLLTILGITSRLILCALPVMVGVVVYVVGVVVFKCITREDCLLLPKGEKIAKLLHL